MLTEEILAAEVLLKPNGAASGGETLEDDNSDESDPQLALRDGREEVGKNYRLSQRKLLPRALSIIAHKRAVEQKVHRIFALLSARPAQPGPLLARAAQLMQSLAEMRRKLKATLAEGAAKNAGAMQNAPHHPASVHHMHLPTEDD